MDGVATERASGQFDERLETWIARQQTRLREEPIVGYANGEAPSAEPVAFSAITACGYKLKSAAEAACRCLHNSQNDDGSVSVRLDDQGPFWTTSLAAIAWRQFERTWPEAETGWCFDAYRNAIDFLTSFGGQPVEPSVDLGHNTLLIGWPWVNGTHSWIEPTAMALMAMRQCGFAKHPRALEAAELLMDRQLPDGGANYGNKLILGQKLRPHVMPSAMCMVALHRFKPQSPAHEETIRYLISETKRPLAAISLSWAIQAIVSTRWQRNDDAQKDIDAILKSAIARLRLTGENSHRQNMLLLAASNRQSPLLDVGYHSFPSDYKLSSTGQTKP